MLADDYSWFHSEGEEIETRRIVNAFIRREFIAMPKWCWRYYDWMEQRGFQMGSWVRELDRLRRDYPLGDMLHCELWRHDCRSYRSGAERPAFLPPPVGWETFDDEVGENPE